jgi:hypothetical protein
MYQGCVICINLAGWQWERETMEAIVIKAVICLAYGLAPMFWLYRDRPGEAKDNPFVSLCVIGIAIAVWCYFAAVITTTVVVVFLWLLWRNRHDIENIVDAVQNKPRPAPRRERVVEQDWLTLRYGDDPGRSNEHQRRLPSPSHDRDSSDREGEESAVDIDVRPARRTKPWDAPNGR